jgi:hypothetical protein
MAAVAIAWTCYTVYGGMLLDFHITSFTMVVVNVWLLAFLALKRCGCVSKAKRWRACYLHCSYWHFNSPLVYARTGVVLCCVVDHTCLFPKSESVGDTDETARRRRRRRADVVT